MTHPVNCYCGNKESIVLFPAGTGSVRRCTRCGQVFITGVDHSSTANYDDQSYFASENGYIDRWEKFTDSFQKMIAKIKRFKPNGALLDVGCGVGIFLDVALRNGYSAKGVEVSKWAAEFARKKGFDVVTGALSDTALPSRSLDVVVLNHVLEHLLDPIETLHETRRILKDDGLLVIGVPNFGSYMARLRKNRWPSLLPDQHIWQFTPESLAALLSLADYTKVYFEARENHPVPWRIPHAAAIIMIINLLSVINSKGEAMLFFARKSS